MPLRILHTADWHVGRSIARRPRLDEHRAVLAEIAAVARDRAVDVAVVAGDVFDRQNPGPGAERVVYDALADLRAACGHVVVIAGNHDSAGRWDALRRLVGDVAIVARPDAPAADAVVAVRGADGTRGHVLCMPWVPEHVFLSSADVSAPEWRSRGACTRHVAARARELVDAAGGGGALVLAAHLFVAKAELGGGERPLTVGGAYNVDADAFPAEIGYVALGHVHRSQHVGDPRVRYAGSPLQLDFSERDDRKHVLVVEVGDGPPRVEAVPMAAGVRLHRVTGTLEEVAARAEAGDLPEGHVQVHLRCDGPQPGLGDRVRELVPGCVEVRLVHDAPAGGGDAPALAGLSYREMFARYLTERAGFTQADPALLERFERLLDEPDADGDEEALPEGVAA